MPARHGQRRSPLHQKRTAVSKESDDSDSGPEEEFKRPAAARSHPRKAAAAAPRGVAKGRRGSLQQQRRETSEERMLRRMEAAPSDNDGDDDSELCSPAGGASYDDFAAAADGMITSDDSGADSEADSGAESGSRNGDAGASAPSDDDEEDIPFEELAARRAGGGAAPRLHSSSSRHGSGLGGADGAGRKGNNQGAQHRENKNRPAEQSSKRPVGRSRDVMQAPKTVGKDPRFEDLSGAYNADRFRKQYAFLYDEQLPAEKSDLKAAMKKVKSAGKREELAAEALRVDGQLREDAARQKKNKFDQLLKAKGRAAVKAGKKPFFLKKTEKKRAELVAKYEELKSTGRLEKYMAKRRRKNAAKDHRYIPGGGRGAEK